MMLTNIQVNNTKFSNFFFKFMMMWIFCFILVLIYRTPSNDPSLMPNNQNANNHDLNTQDANNIQHPSDINIHSCYPGDNTHHIRCNRNSCILKDVCINIDTGEITVFAPGKPYFSHMIDISTFSGYPTQCCPSYGGKEPVMQKFTLKPDKFPSEYQHNTLAVIFAPTTWNYHYSHLVHDNLFPVIRSLLGSGYWKIDDNVSPTTNNRHVDLIMKRGGFYFFHFNEFSKLLFHETFKSELGKMEYFPNEHGNKNTIYCYKRAILGAGNSWDNIKDFCQYNMKISEFTDRTSICNALRSRISPKTSNKVAKEIFPIPHITILNRKNSRTIPEDLLKTYENHLQELQKIGKLIFLGTKYAENMSFYEQQKHFSNVSILITPHGNGETNLIFMPKHSVILEVPSFNLNWYQRLSSKCSISRIFSPNKEFPNIFEFQTLLEKALYKYNNYEEPNLWEPVSGVDYQPQHPIIISSNITTI